MSCWKVNLHPSFKFLASSTRFSSNTARYLDPSPVFSVLTSLPDPYLKKNMPTQDPATPLFFMIVIVWSRGCVISFTIVFSDKITFFYMFTVTSKWLVANFQWLSLNNSFFLSTLPWNPDVFGSLLMVLLSTDLSAWTVNLCSSSRLNMSLFIALHIDDFLSFPFLSSGRWTCLVMVTEVSYSFHYQMME